MMAAVQSGWGRMATPGRSLLCYSGVLVFFLFLSTAVPAHIKKEMQESPETYSHYYDHKELSERLHSLAQEYPELCRLSSLGMSVEARELWVMRVTADPDAAPPDRPQFKYVGNMHGDETVSRQVLIYLLQYLLENYGRDQRVTSLINTTDIYIVPSLNPDGFQRAKEGDCQGQKGGRENGRRLDLNRKFPDQFSKQQPPDPEQVPEVVAMMKWIQENR